MKKINIIFFLSLFLINACSKEDKKISVIKETRQDLEMISAYKEGYIALNQGDPFFAAKKFLEAELLFPQSKWAPRSALMASYSYYMQNYYAEAIANLEQLLLNNSKWSYLWRLLAKASSKINKKGISYIALAEEALIKKNFIKAKKYVDLANKQSSIPSSYKLRGKDILARMKIKK